MFRKLGTSIFALPPCCWQRPLPPTRNASRDMRAADYGGSPAPAHRTSR